MSHLAKRRRKVAWEGDVPRCQTCVHFRKAAFFLRNSLPVKTPPICGAENFVTAPMAICNKWQDAKGATLIKY